MNRPAREKIEEFKRMFVSMEQERDGVANTHTTPATKTEPIIKRDSIAALPQSPKRMHSLSQEPSKATPEFNEIILQKARELAAQRQREEDKLSPILLSRKRKPTKRAQKLISRVPLFLFPFLSLLPLLIVPFNLFHLIKQELLSTLNIPFLIWIDATLS